MAVRPARAPDLPMTALRALESAARLGGFAPAAAELGVTPAAITAQIKGLEARLGLSLFTREVRGVRLTEAGTRVLPSLTAAFDAMDSAQTALRQEAAPLSLTIATLPSVAQLWLRPRLAALEAAMPGLAVSITAMEAAPTTRRETADIALFFGPGGRDVLVPVAPSGRTDLPRLSDATWAGDWTVWQRALPGEALPGRGAGAVHSLYALAVEDALSGRGVLMARLSLVESFLAEGRLEEVGSRVQLNQGMQVTVLGSSTVARRVARQISAWIAEQRGHG
ncbi:transcriptional regulator, LysR family [Jannaschia faecimaris]|uniref:Transcriptional regulator, LysR family n=1 Tax=Jannaschia faecimaris TaxID=1244108 RepID=A0A1H3QWA4_9RHOB|nr:LysR family transcriptional regulator [Jannaschia faecimaris]SDZ17305.1 transcriptional regulator, LysR family [Jannaschia faecimaris]